MKRLFIYLVLSVLLTGCNTIDTSPEPALVEQTLQEILEEALLRSFDHIAGASMTVIAPDIDLHWTGSAGFDSNERDQELHPDQPFRIASITKTFVAAAMLRLEEQGRLELDDPISKYLTADYTTLLKEGGYTPEQITWRQCLNHTSGLYDYAMGGRTFEELAMNNPQKRWTRKEQVQLAMETGQATGEPGERYSYGDTGYVLAGATLEMMQDTNLGSALRELLAYEKLGLESTWLETIEPAPVDHQPLVHCYFKRMDVTDWDPSIDLYGGGGLVSSTHDLATFFHGLFNNQVFEHSATLEHMLSAPEYSPSYDPTANPRHKDYRLGLWKIDIFGHEAFMHGGLWSTVILHVPDLNCTIAVKYTQGRWDRLLKQVVLTVKNLQEAQ